MMRGTLAQPLPAANQEPVVSPADPAPRAPRPRTLAVHGPERRPGPVSSPVVHSATFSFASLEDMMRAQQAGAAGAFYQRYGHPTLRACEERFAAIEGAGMALLFSSGMAAISAAFLGNLRAGDHVVALHQCYGGTPALLAWGAERLGWRYDLVDAREPEQWERAFTDATRILHVESPTNPTLEIVDLERAAALAHAHGAMLVADNTFASPVGQHPLALGADLAVYSATKSIGGHGDLLAGAVTGSTERLEAVWKARKVFGAVPDPQLAWLVERSLKTLALRVEAANANALALAARLSRHGAVARVFYPGLPESPGHAIARRQMTLGFGPVVAFETRGGADAAVATVNALRVFLHAPSLGGVESLASLPAYTSHIALGPEGRARAGIPEGMVRLSVGIEDVEDLWEDLDGALSGGSHRV
jgi:cystathionine beta-lyase/cystathionine gamma-synthase